MPIRPKQHIAGDLALAAVQRVCLLNGWACDSVKSDYGEDLMVQPQLDDEMDPFKIWIQVKGTDAIDRYKLSTGDYSFPVSVRLALKWSRATEVILFVLWDLPRNEGFWAMPRSAIDTWQLHSANQDSIQLPIKSAHRFDEKQSASLVWDARIDHFTIRIREASRRDEYLKTQSPIENANSTSHIPIIGAELLLMLRVVDEHGLIGPFQWKIFNYMRKEKLASPERTVRQRMISAITLAVLSAFNERNQETGLTSEVIRVCCNTIVELLSRCRLLPELRDELDA